MSCQVMDVYIISFGTSVLKIILNFSMEMVEILLSGRVLAAGSKDMSTKLYSLEKLANFKVYSLGSHTDCVVACFFEKGSLDLTTLSRNGQVCVWECSIDMDSLRSWEPPVKKMHEETHSDSEDDIDTSRAEEYRAVEQVAAGKVRFK